MYNELHNFYASFCHVLVVFPPSSLAEVFKYHHEWCKQLATVRSLWLCPAFLCSAFPSIDRFGRSSAWDGDRSAELLWPTSILTASSLRRHITWSSAQGLSQSFPRVPIVWHQWNWEFFCQDLQNMSIKELRKKVPKMKDRPTKVTVIVATYYNHYIQYFLVSRCTLFPQTTSDQNPWMYRGTFILHQTRTKHVLQSLGLKTAFLFLSSLLLPEFLSWSLHGR